ncbi:hypothetical protein BDQ17DRAFT_1348714 [Cyathus striatus]|nr:hypothetical protein BDQ17DRAFT_1376454 [Cyathus striatus]KAF9009720.1 hypothetical protein BDQ17DRAFT_1348714 [Cyathus striatus]
MLCLLCIGVITFCLLQDPYQFGTNIHAYNMRSKAYRHQLSNRRACFECMWWMARLVSMVHVECGHTWNGWSRPQRHDPCHDYMQKFSTPSSYPMHRCLRTELDLHCAAGESRNIQPPE